MIRLNISRFFIVTLMALTIVVFCSTNNTIEAGKKNTSSGSGWNSWNQDDHSSGGKGHGKYGKSHDDDSSSDDKSSGHKPKKKKPSKNWLTKGNKNIDHDKHFLGTTDEADLVIKTNNTEKARITIDGDVGIGTASPTGTLHVEGGTAAADTDGKDVTIEAQDGGPTTGAGGNIVLTPGTDGDGSSSGTVYVGEIDTLDPPILTLDVNGQIRIRGGSPFLGAVLTSDSFGNATWQSINDADADPTNELNTAVSLSGTVLSVTDAGGAKFADLASLIDDADADPTNELNTGISFDGANLAVTDAGGSKTVNISSLQGTDDQNLTGATLSGTTLQVDIEGGSSASVDLAGLQDGTGSDDQNLTGATLSGTTLQVDIEGGSSASVDLAGLQDGTGTDDQNLSTAVLAGTLLQMGIEDGTGTSVDLAALQDGTGTDDQNLTGATLSGTTLQVDIEGGSSASIDLAGLQDGTGTDDQNLSTAVLSGTLLQMGIEDGTGTSVDLAALQDGTGTDDQNLSTAVLSGTLLQMGIEDGTGTSVDLAALQDGTGTDDQNLSTAVLTGTLLQMGIEDGTGTSVDLASLQDGTGTDDQNLSTAVLTGTLLQMGIEDGTGTSVDLASLQDGTGTDDQNLALSGTDLSIEAGNTVDLSGVGTDNLGDHTATQNISLMSFWLSGDGGNEGISIDSVGNVGIGTNSPITNLTLRNPDTNWSVQTNLTLEAGDFNRGRAAMIWQLRDSDAANNGGLHFAVRNDSNVATVSDSKMFINESTGNVGIGTTSPTEKLTVAGNIVPSLTDAYSLGTAGNVWQDVYVGSNSLNIGGTTLSNNGGTLNWNSLPLGIWSLNGTSAYYNDGDVGIGTVSPERMLHISGPAPIIRFEDTTNVADQDWATGVWGNDLRFVEEGEGTRMALVDGGNLGIGQNFTTPGSMLGVQGNVSIGSSYAASAAPADGLLIEGKVGIGTTSPVAKLHIEGGAGNVALNIEGAENEGSTAAVKIGTAGSSQVMLLDGNEIDTPVTSLNLNGNVANNVLLAAGGGDVLLAPGAGGGKVGIGTATPGSLLHVSGPSSTWGDLAKFERTDTNESDLVLKSGGAGWLSFLTNGGFIFNTGVSTDLVQANILTNNPRLVIDSTGNVGIGTTSPSTKLDVNGTVRIRGGSPGAGKVLTASDANGLATWADASGSNLWSELNSNVYYNSGNVGIGTDSPQGVLDVVTSTNGTVTGFPFYFKNTNAGGHGMLLEAGGPLVDHESFSINNQAGTRLFSVRGNGNVGIGTTSPSRQFEVVNNVTGQVNDMISLRTTGAGGQGALLGVDTLNKFVYFKRNATNTYGMQFLQAPGNPWMTLASGGNVGIGTTAPDEKLHVEGNIKMVDGTQGANKVLTSDANGVGTWQAPSGGSLWSLNGSNAYYDTGNVNIGSATSPNPNIKLYVHGNATVFGASTGNPNSYLTDFGGAQNYIRGQTVFDWGNVGIGTAAPGAKLQVSGGAIMPAAGNTSTSGIYFPENPFGGAGDAAWIRYNSQGGENTNLEIGISNDGNDDIALMASGGVGIGTTSPSTNLDVNGTVRIRGGSPGAGKVLTASDATGFATWTDAASGADDLGNHTATTTLNLNSNAITGFDRLEPFGIGGNSGQGNHSYAIFQEAGAWSHPYPDLRIAYHTGIKIGALNSYNGTRFYNNSDMVTQTFSVNDGDDDTRFYYGLRDGTNNRVVIDDEGGWHRSYGNTGWYNGTHDGGWYMTDATWLRSWGGKGISLGAGVANTKLALWDNGGGGLYGMGISASTFRFHTNSAGDAFRFYNAPAGSELMAIEGGGDVGIGTADPLKRLHVYANSEQLRLQDPFGHWDFYAGVNLHLRDSGGVNRVVVEGGTGYVGIGVANPSQPLHMASGAHVTVGGVWTNASSREYKENIIELTYDNALSALKNLTPVTYNYKVEKDENYVGFLAEDVPDLVATNDRKSLSSMDIVAVLTKVTKKQQEEIEQLKNENIQLKGTLTALTDRQSAIEDMILALSVDLPNDKLVKLGVSQ